RELAGADLRDDAPPQHAALHHVGLVDRHEAAAPPARQHEPNARNARDLGGRIEIRVEGLERAIGALADAARLAEIDAAAELAQHHDVHAGNDLLAERRAAQQ